MKTYSDVCVTFARQKPSCNYETEVLLIEFHKFSTCLTVCVVTLLLDFRLKMFEPLFHNTYFIISCIYYRPKYCISENIGEIIVELSGFK
jgi:hypothetical protein